MAYADLVFTNGPVYTVDAARSWARAVAVRDGRVVAVGTDSEVAELVGPNTERIDLNGRLLIPGFQDAHVHPVFAGLTMSRCDLSEAETQEQTVGTVAAYAAAHPEVEWILGGAWSFDAFPGGLATRQMLDAVVADRPVYLPVRDGHSAWVNTRALELAGIDKNTPDPADGRIEREPDGTPSGILHEGAMGLVGHHAPSPTHADYLKGLTDAQSYLHSLGITAWQDAIIGGYGGWNDQYDVYLEAAATGLLTARVRGALWWDRDQGAEQLDFLLDRRARGTVGRFNCGTIKLMQDGITENFTAGMAESYLDACGCQTGNNGLSMVDPALLREYITLLDTHGFQVHFHAIGDRAVREVLDAVEAARKVNGFNDLRHHVAHVQVVDPVDIPRFRALDVAVNMQPLWAAHEVQMDELNIPFLGSERASWQYPFRAFQQAGAVLAAGSDWSVSSPDPMAGIHVAVNRRVPASEGDYPVFLPEQRLDLGTAIAAYTAGSAYVNHLDETGSIEVGKLADLVVLDRDPFAAPAEAIYETRTALTYVEGERVYAADNA
ncbi:amidohydrolase [Yinghuangia seranimata]|uniref:amidohydrolase n=1 Tax=Yinghuangia seranimata TaxID=408067 RepID=UPI00248B4770|nr:amidohydrolase [Yinghuangia seranimata]MDI2128796.1 amidohydrolase [Yinghuangia seranimata]